MLPHRLCGEPVSAAEGLRVFPVTGVKAFSCSVCNASFTTNGSLTRHMATHMSMKPYKCPFCEQGFRTTVHCKKHMKRHQTTPAAATGEAEAGGTVLAATPGPRDRLTQSPREAQVVSESRRQGRTRSAQGHTQTGVRVGT